MLNRLRIWNGRVAVPTTADLLTGLMRVDAHSRVAVMVLALGPRLRGRIDLAKCLQLAAIADVARDAAEILADPLPALAAEKRNNLSPEARLIETLRRLSVQMELNRVSANRWSEEDRRRLFDSDHLARRCSADPLLAELFDAVWSQGVEQLKRTGRNPTEIALDAMGYNRDRPAARRSR